MEDSCLLSLNDEKLYKEYDSGIKWNDEKLGIEWPFNRQNTQPIISDRDAGLQSFDDYLKS